MCCNQNNPMMFGIGTFSDCGCNRCSQCGATADFVSELFSSNSCGCGCGCNGSSNRCGGSCGCGCNG